MSTPHFLYHHPGGSVVTLAKSCQCRKPRPGLLLAAASELGLDLPGSWMIGDSSVDVEAGLMQVVERFSSSTPPGPSQECA